MAKNYKKLLRRTKGKAVLFDQREPRTGRIRKGRKRGAYLRALGRLRKEKLIGKAPAEFPPPKRKRTPALSELIR